MAIDPQSAPYLASEEQNRGDQLRRFVDNVASDPGNATHNSLPLYQAAIRNAYANAAKYGEQPEGVR